MGTVCSIPDLPVGVEFLRKQLNFEKEDQPILTSPLLLRLFFKQKINNILMNYPIATHIKLVH